MTERIEERLHPLWPSCHRRFKVSLGEENEHGEGYASEFEERRWTTGKNGHSGWS